MGNSCDLNLGRFKVLFLYD